MQTILNGNNLKSFFIKLACFFAGVFLVDLAIGSVLKKYYFKEKAGLDYETTYALDSAKADIIVLGSSRASNIFDAEILEKELNMSCYNAGRYGLPLFYHHAVLKAIQKRQNPQLVILAFDAGNFSKNAEAYDKMSTLLPYYSYHPEIRSMVDLKGPFEKIKMLSKIYPFNSMIFPIITGNSASAKMKNTSMKGYIPIHNSMSVPPPTFDYTKDRELDTVKINAYKAIIQDCIKDNIKICIVCPPYNIHAIGNDASITAAKEIAAQLNVDFFDHTFDSKYTKNKELFYDFRHLNVKGVGLFCVDVANEIKNK